ncbi:MAG: hypothetical protein CVU32_00835 [Betaproteobacteria bacterium HGW-Betaproteobacteria-5]|jgi:hypothetical protein|nr:MAG: hypothetical protein CVU32_00835 [Betaproteobacteria bacterium HGW-Betaproteobacteria-5]PKO40751.1 MAG: hypothetical protein CVU33_01925 [Betaproteobacteria bacterium HGW-Betaproteobacteria-6]
MKSLTTLARHLRYPMIGILIALVALFYVRKMDGPPFPLSPDEASTVCTATVGCKALAFAHRYDPALQRRVVAVRIAVDKKRRKDEVPARLLQAIDDRQASRSWLAGWGWAGRRLEVRYE